MISRKQFTFLDAFIISFGLTLLMVSPVSAYAGAGGTSLVNGASQLHKTIMEIFYWVAASCLAMCGFSLVTGKPDAWQQFVRCIWGCGIAFGSITILSGLQTIFKG